MNFIFLIWKFYGKPILLWFFSGRYEDRWDYVPDVMGCENRGYGPAEPGTDVALVSEKLH